MLEFAHLQTPCYAMGTDCKIEFLLSNHTYSKQVYMPGNTKKGGCTDEKKLCKYRTGQARHHGWAGNC